MRTGGQCLAVVMALLLAGPAPVLAQEPAVQDEGTTPAPEAVPTDPTEQAAKDAADQSPKGMIGSRWPVKTDDAPVPFVAKKTDRLGEAMREVQAAQEAAAKAAAEEAAADARAAERAAAAPSGKRFAGRRGRGGKHFAGRSRGGTRARHAASSQRAAGKQKSAAKAVGKTRQSAKGVKPGKKQAAKPARRHKA